MQFIQVIHKCGIQRLYEDTLRGDLFFLKEKKKNDFHVLRQTIVKKQECTCIERFRAECCQCKIEGFSMDY